MAFLSLMDERIRAKGSRDPLGFEPVWTSFGRQLVGNLTTVTSSWTNFAVALLGFHWSNELCRDAPKEEKLKAIQNCFVKYEQLAGYLRCTGDNSNGDVLGITRVNKNLRADSGSIILGTKGNCLILSDQISYGLWGLYSSAMRATDLVGGDNRMPTDNGIAIAGLIEKRIDKGAFIEVIQGSTHRLSQKELAKLRPSFLSAIEHPEVKNELIRNLLHGPSGHSLQASLLKATRELTQSELSANTASYVEALLDAEIPDELSRRLSDIKALERLLVSVNILFDYCRRKDGQQLAKIVMHIKERLNFSYIPETPALQHCRYGSELETIRRSLRQGQTREALLAIFELNRHVMQDRGGAPWIELDGSATLRVRINSEVSELRSQKDIEQEWHYSYFLASFARIAAEYNV